jgi:hypothetical protein
MWQRTNSQPGMTVLDVGSGPGFVSLQLAVVGPTGALLRSTRVKSLAALQRRAKKQKIFHIETYVCDLSQPDAIQRLSLASASIDLMVCRWIFMYLQMEEIVNVIRGLVRLLPLAVSWPRTNTADTSEYRFRCIMMRSVRSLRPFTPVLPHRMPGRISRQSSGVAALRCGTSTKSSRSVDRGRSHGIGPTSSLECIGRCFSRRGQFAYQSRTGLDLRALESHACRCEGRFRRMADSPDDRAKARPERSCVQRLTHASHAGQGWVFEPGSI